MSAKTAMMQREINAEQSFQRVGYYLVHYTGRYFISDKINEYLLNKICNKVLTDTDYQYWIDYSLGSDVKGNVAWVNMDQTDLFI